jgi:hypothetical protein
MPYDWVWHLLVTVAPLLNDPIKHGGLENKMPTFFNSPDKKTMVAVLFTLLLSRSILADVLADRLNVDCASGSDVTGSGFVLLYLLLPLFQ